MPQRVSAASLGDYELYQAVFAKVRSYVSLMRPISWMPFYIPLLLAMYDGGMRSLGVFWLVLLIIGPCALGAVYVWNFYSDREVDKKSRVFKDLPMASQPFATGEVSGIEGLIFSFILAILSIVLSYAFLPQAIVWLVAGSLVLGFVYSFPPRLKERPPFDVVANVAAVAVMYPLGWIAAGNKLASLSLGPLGWIMLFILGGYFLSALLDYEADKKSGVRTTAVAIGRKRVLKTVFWSHVASLPFLAYALYVFPSVYYALLLFWLLMGTSSLWRLQRARYNYQKVWNTTGRIVFGGLCFTAVLVVAGTMFLQLGMPLDILQLK